MNVPHEPTALGSVVRVTTDRSKYPEIWISSHINQGRWYPDTDSWFNGSARHDLPDGALWEDLTARGKVTLLTDGKKETYNAGWVAGAEACAHAAQDIAGQTP